MYVKIKKYGNCTLLVRFFMFIGLWRIAWKLEKWIDNRRVTVKVDDYDTWSLDVTLAEIILPSLIRLKKLQNGAPVVDFEDVPEHLRPPKEEWEYYQNNWMEDTDKHFHDRWDWIVDEMIFAFNSCITDWEEQCYEDGKFSEEGYEKEKEIQARVDNGIRLFGKYYRALWT